MSSSIKAAASSMQALSRQYHAIAHNMANANTAGYKRRVTTFTQALQQATLPENAESMLPLANLSTEVVLDQTQGALQQTGRQLDFALEGDGFFAVDTRGGTRYTRNGAFQLNANRQLVDVMGNTVQGDSGPIIVPSGVSTSQIRLESNGRLYAGNVEFGKLRMVEFEDPKALVPVGNNNMIAASDATTKDATNTRVLQGYQESSNVNTIEELVGLISVSRMYEANLKSIKAHDEQMKRILDVAMS